MSTTTIQPGQMTRAARELPAPVPGQESEIPLDLLPIYLAVHQLEAMTLAEVGKLAATGQRKADGVCWVKKADRA